jgi:uncharacterized protein
MGQAHYDPLYLRGVDEFNREHYFQSHEVWEDLWIGESGSARLFYKGLIQAAVALHHLTNGNAHGARKLLAGCERYLRPYRSRYMGLDVDGFTTAMNGCVEDVLAGHEATAGPALMPKITLQPPPEGNDVGN